ncbi:hypothetical protein EJ08DRAFT_649433 [Tothia fuscella]|uniref:Uncharacterized protein n=1 Tax=Tothia fuscella TaxID=1048955 RepID=A0A9P4NS13_9PEZI|nr:hypothetical protein EJ08DRAFT_649433 [Tothia fuscella]
MALELIKQALHPLAAIAWGDLAIGRLGVPTVICSYMFVIADSEMNEAIQKFHDAGFIHKSWSFGSAVDPKTVSGNPVLREMHDRTATSWASLDCHSTRFTLPPNSGFADSQVVLFPNSYVDMTLPTSASDPRFHAEDNLYYPEVYPLLESIAKLQAKGQTTGEWEGLLNVWAITYLYGHLHLADNVLDSCGNADILRWFNTKIRRFEGGLER